ncbi:MAG: flagellar export protein FliJ [Rhizomicrobium sp.]|jgi:flagellar FliJ protein
MMAEEEWGGFDIAHNLSSHGDRPGDGPRLCFVGQAMKRRDTLLHLKRFKVDDLKRRLATLEGMGADLERKLADLEESVARERQRANDTDIGRLAFPSFVRSIDGRRENIRNSLTDIERERSQCHEEMAAAYQDLKSMELAIEQEARRASEAEARREQSRVEEMAIVRHLRKHAMRPT